MELNWLLRFLFHVTTFGVYVTAVIYDTYYLPTHIGRQSYAGRFKFLTVWNELFQTAFFGYSIVNDIFGSNSKPVKDKADTHRSRLEKFRDLVAASIIFPIGTFVVITFWSLYYYDRELVYPKVLDAVVPSWLNHVWHTFVLFFLLIEKIFVYHRYPKRSKGLFYAALVNFVYLVWIHWIAFWANIWVYPLLAVMNWPSRIIFYIICVAFTVVCYFLGELITKAFWGSSTRVKFEEVKQQ